MIGQEIILDQEAKAALASNIANGISQAAGWGTSETLEDLEAAAARAVNEELQNQKELQIFVDGAR